MAFVNFKGAQAALDMSDPDLVQFASAEVAFGTVWSWLTPNGTDLDLKGSNLTFDGQGRATGGRVSEVRIDIGNNSFGIPDILVTGLNALAAPLDDNPDAFWGGVLQGNDIIDATALAPVSQGFGPTSRVFGDDRAHNTDVIRSNNIGSGGNDVITMGAGNYLAVGDVMEVRGDFQAGFVATYNGGNDQLLVNAVEHRILLLGDALDVGANADLFGGDDLLQFAGSGTVSGDIRGISSVSRVSRLEGGDDRLEARVGSTADIAGDAIQTNVVSLIVGGADTIEDSDLGNRMAGDVLFDFNVAGSNNVKGRILGGDDEISGNGGNDIISGDLLTRFAATVVGGDDTVRGGDGQDVIYGEIGKPVAAGASGGDDQLFGDAGNDQLFGQTGNDELFGGTGFDKLDGGVGNDRLDGGLDNDDYRGGVGNDVFVFGPLSGNDRVLDFENGKDRFDLLSTMEFSDLVFTAVAADGDGLVNDVRIDFFNQSITVMNRGLGLFDASDFLF